jgi:uncharacterized protein YceK
MLRAVTSTIPIVTLTAFMGGCGTLTNQAEPGTMLNPSGATPYRPFGGVSNCASDLVGEARIVAGLPADDSRRDIDSFSAAGYAAGTVFLNLPLSLVADTIMFPFDVTNTLRGRGEPPEGGWPMIRARAQAGSTP